MVNNSYFNDWVNESAHRRQVLVFVSVDARTLSDNRKTLPLARWIPLWEDKAQSIFIYLCNWNGKEKLIAESQDSVAVVVSQAKLW